MQTPLVGHETAVMGVGWRRNRFEDHDAPSNLRMWPYPSTAMHKLLVGQETEGMLEVPSTLVGEDQDPPA
jgi:hypothetical protein